jgi:phosphoglycolate phosphatase-like HAD superfamily hydrolase
VDVARVSRDAYAEAFRRVTGRSLVALPQLAGASDSEIFFDALALNDAPQSSGQPEDNDLLGRYSAALAAAFGARTEQLTAHGRSLPGAREALAAVSRLPNVIQTVITGTIRQNAASKLHAFDLDRHLDLAIGGYGSDVYPKGTQIVRSLAMATEKYGVQVMPAGAVYVADSVRDVAAASVADVRCLGIATGRSTISELRDAGADPVLTDLTDTSRVVAAISR